MASKSSSKVKSLVKISLVLILFVSSDIHTRYLSKYSISTDAAVPQGNDWQDLLLTQEEKQKLDLFKAKVIGKLPDDYMKTDVYLIRWLRARNLDINLASDMLFMNLRWRDQNGMKKILSEDFSDVADDFGVTTDNSHDKKKRPVGTLSLGAWDMRKGVLQGKVQRISRYIDRYQEQLVQHILRAQESGQTVTRGITLVDADGFNVFQHLCPSCLQVLVRLMSGMESHYPGYWEEIIVVNAPSIFGVLLNALQGIMSKQTREVLKVFDKNKSKWMSYLDERIERDQRYVNYGGTRNLK